MRFYSCVLALLLLIIIFSQKSYAQDSLPSKISALPERFFSSIDKKTTSIESKLEKQTIKFLVKLQKQEARLKKKLLQKDSTLAAGLFQQGDVGYTSLQSVPQHVSKYSSVYSGHLDSLSTALSFLKGSHTAAMVNNPQLEKTLEHLQGLQGRLNQTDQIQKYLEERQQLLKDGLQKLGMLKELQKFNKQVYYYSAQIKEYQQLFENPGKLEAKLMEVVMSVPQFQDFFARNSQLGSIFALPTSTGNSSVLSQGLQTRAMLNDYLNQRFGSAAEVTNKLQQNMQTAQANLNALKSKANQYASGAYGNTNGNIEQPDFRPRQIKTKSFLKRLEWGGNLQTQKAKSLYPTTSDIAATLGYQITDRSVAGVGISYKLGWGGGWDHIKLSHQGVGLRSYIDFQLKGSFYLSGGYEQNYRTAFASVEQLKPYSAWQSSGLVGFTKKYRVSNKIKGNMQLLWDFLSYQQVPKTSQPVLFRIGYHF